VIDGADLDNADPPVWTIDDRDAPCMQWGSTTGWLDELKPNVERHRSMLERLAMQGKPVPSWAGDIGPR
jgi:hypothetical protein